ncbi:type I glyceraldehyde-3-phosphate dehydrogenase [Elusimicrobiota bacterium]
MAIRVAINGFGRIGRLLIRAGFGKPDIEWVAVNDIGQAEVMAHLLKYDSNFGIYKENVRTDGSKLFVGKNAIEITSCKEPKDLPWKSMGIDYVVESTGKFTDAAKAKGHIDAGAKRVIISAPAKSEDITICMGINEDKYDPKSHHIISNASCTTNCLGFLAKVLNENFKLKCGLMTTIHAITNDQPTMDFPHKDLRRARAASASMIPTSTGAAKAIGLVLPELAGKLNGIAVRAPVLDVSLVDLACEVEKETTKEAVNDAFKKAHEKTSSKYLAYCDGPLVSRDFLGNPASCIFDATLTDVMQGNLVKAFGWYDNEWGYSCRLVDLILHLAEKDGKLSDKSKSKSKISA